jgi:hypothetical protein
MAAHYWLFARKYVLHAVMKVDYQAEAPAMKIIQTARQTLPECSAQALQQRSRCGQ